MMMQRRLLGRCTPHLAPASVKGLRGCAGSSQISILDFSASGAAKELDASFQATGFAVVTGHGVDFAALRDLRRKSLDFFHLPVQDKQLYNKKQGYGHGGYLNQEEAAAQLLGDFNKPNDLVESLTLPGQLPRLDDASRDGPGESRAEVPDVPTIVPGFQAAADAVQSAMRDFRNRLELLVCQALDQSPDAMLHNVDTTAGGIRLAYYPEQTTPPVPGQMRYGAHVDSGGITVLIRDEHAQWGTQVQLGGGDWVDVPVADEAIVLNVGALLSRWTNGRWRASIHRVANGSKERLSIVASAMVIKDEAHVVPLSSCVSASNPSRYEPVKAGDFLKERVRLHRDSYAQEHGMSQVQATMNLQKEIRDYQR